MSNWRVIIVRKSTFFKQIESFFKKPTFLLFERDRERPSMSQERGENPKQAPRRP